MTDDAPEPGVMLSSVDAAGTGEVSQFPVVHQWTAVRPFDLKNGANEFKSRPGIFGPVFYLKPAGAL